MSTLPSAQSPVRSTAHACAIFGVFALAYWLSYGLRAVNAVLGVPLQTELGVSSAQLGLLSSMYFLSFACMQLPLGMLLDRFGPRRIEVTLLFVAALACVAFAQATDFSALCVARAAIGIGVSACLMAPYKGYRQWFADKWQAPLSAWMLMVGTAGALSATIPVEWALPFLGWRGLFYVVGALLCLAALLQWWILPRPVQSGPPDTIHAQWQGFLHILRSPTFWRYAPPAIFLHGGFMAIQGLWAGPWMQQVEGKTGSAAAHSLFIIGLGLLFSYFCLAGLSRWMMQRHIPLSRAMTIGMLLALAFFGLIITPIDIPQPYHAVWQISLWVAYAMCISVMSFGYTAINMSFPAHLTGRTSTALNFMIFMGAFFLQWGLGGLIDGLQHLGFSVIPAYRLSFAVFLGLQILALMWFIAVPRWTSWRSMQLSQLTKQPPASDV